MSALDLLQNRLKAQYLVVPDDHPEVLAHVPQAQVGQRQQRNGSNAGA